VVKLARIWTLKRDVSEGTPNCGGLGKSSLRCRIVSSVSAVTCLWSYWPENLVSIVDGFFATACWGPLICCTVGTGVSFPKGGRAGAWSSQLAFKCQRLRKSGAARAECSSRRAWTVVRIQYHVTFGSLCCVCRIYKNASENLAQAFSRLMKLEILVHLQPNRRQHCRCTVLEPVTH